MTQLVTSRQGWRTFGDIGHVDDDGYLYLTDRQGFMVISGGVNIYPQEIENTLLTHAEVIDVAVFGVPDDDLGEKLAAVIQLSDGAHADEEKATGLRELCRALGGGIKVPKLIRFCPAFPRLDNGKVLKRLLRDRVLNEPLPRATFGSLASA